MPPNGFLAPMCKRTRRLSATLHRHKNLLTREVPERFENPAAKLRPPDPQGMIAQKIKHGLMNEGLSHRICSVLGLHQTTLSCQVAPLLAMKRITKPKPE